MEKLTYIQIGLRKAKYNDVLKKGLTKLNIDYTVQSTKYGQIISAPTNQIDKARIFLLSISLKNPQYLK